MNFPAARRVWLAFFLFTALGLLSGYFIFRYPWWESIFLKGNGVEANLSQKKLPPPSVSGWIAWWKEDPAYEMLTKYPGEIESVSPVWFMVGSKLELTGIGKYDKNLAVEKLRNLNIKILPSLGSELSSDQISVFLNDEAISEALIGKLTAELVGLGVTGLDVDLENIKKEDKEAFNSFLERLSRSLKTKNLKLSITIHAQTGRIVWDGVLGQDVKKIGEIADEVRIMAYDEHSASTKEGSIASLAWIKEVALYNAKLISKDKIVIGIPSYGYVWTSDDAKGLQYDEFYAYLADKQYESKRDKESAEEIFSSPDFIGYLSDSTAMTEKIDSLRALGFNRFVIWNLGGMDEKFFETSWQE